MHGHVGNWHEIKVVACSTYLKMSNTDTENWHIYIQIQSVFDPNHHVHGINKQVAIN